MLSTASVRPCMYFTFGRWEVLVSSGSVEPLIADEGILLEGCTCTSLVLHLAREVRLLWPSTQSRILADFTQLPEG